MKTLNINGQSIKVWKIQLKLRIYNIINTVLNSETEQFNGSLKLNEPIMDQKSTKVTYAINYNSSLLFIHILPDIVLYSVWIFVLSLRKL
jgi:hypothetical protein